MGSIIKDHLEIDEHLVSSTNPHWIILLPSATWVILLLVSAVAPYHDLFPPLSSTILFTIYLVILLAALVKLASAFLYFVSTEMVVTNRRIAAKTGFIRRTTLELPHERVEGFTVDQSVVGRVFGYGTITAIGMGGSAVGYPFLRNPISMRRSYIEQQG